MISAIVILSLLSLLVATDPDPVSHASHPSPEPPVRPGGKGIEAKAEPSSNRLAA